MSDRDPELESLLEPLRQTKPSSSETRRWLDAIVKAPAKPAGKRPRFPRPVVWQLLAACFVGIIVGTLLASKMQPAVPCDKPQRQLTAGVNHTESAVDATIAQIHVKID